MPFGNPLIPAELSALRRFSARAKPGTLNLGLGQPAVDMHPRLRELAPEALAAHKLGYTPNAGAPALREAVGKKYGLSAEHVLITHGAQEGLMAVLLSLLAKGDEVLLPDPGFLAYPTMVRMAGGRARLYPLRRKDGTFRYSAEIILKELTKRTRAVLLCSPNNPTGTMIEEGERARLLKELTKRKVFLISDDVYAELAFGAPYRPVSAESPYGVTVSSWSKSLALTGWRIGFAHCSHPGLAPRMLAAHQYLTTCASAPAQALVLEALSRPKIYEEVLSSFRAEYRQKLALLHSLLPAGRAELPGGGFYLFLRLPSRSDTKAAEALLEERNLLVVPGSFFGGGGRGFVRVSVAASEGQLRRAGTILSAHFGSQKDRGC